MAHDAGVTASTYGLIERGHSNPTWATVRDVAEALGTSVGDLARLAEKLEWIGGLPGSE